MEVVEEGPDRTAPNSPPQSLAWPENGEGWSPIPARDRPRPSCRIAITGGAPDTVSDRLLPSQPEGLITEQEPGQDSLLISRPEGPITEKERVLNKRRVLTVVHYDGTTMAGAAGTSGLGPLPPASSANQGLLVMQQEQALSDEEEEEGELLWDNSHLHLGEETSQISGTDKEETQLGEASGKGGCPDQTDQWGATD